MDRLTSISIVAAIPYRMEFACTYVVIEHLLRAQSYNIRLSCCLTKQRRHQPSPPALHLRSRPGSVIPYHASARSPMGSFLLCITI